MTGTERIEALEKRVAALEQTTQPKEAKYDLKPGGEKTHILATEEMPPYDFTHCFDPRKESKSDAGL